MISANEAKERISRYVERGMPNRMIIDRMDRLGVSPTWIHKQLEQLRGESHPTGPVPETPDARQKADAKTKEGSAP